MKVMDVLGHQPFEVPFVQRNYVIQEIPAAGSDPSLGNAVLPGAAEEVLTGWSASAVTAWLTCSPNFASRSQIRYLLLVS